MSDLAFLPWFTVNEALSIGGYDLLPFERGRQPGGPLQAVIDAVLRPYVPSALDEPVSRATLLVPTGTALTADMSGEVIDDLFSVAELVAFSGLAARRYFRQFEYSNRDTFTFIVQSFQDPTGAVGLRVRRRDGSTGIMVSPNVYRVRRPYHVPDSTGVRVDVRLLEALLAVRGDEAWDSLEEAIYFFNQANTDGDLTPTQWETVAMYGAFERALGLSNTHVGDFVRSFLAIWPAPGGSCPNCTRIPLEHRGTRSLREVWLRDLYQHRGQSAHGRREAQHRAVWTPREHLLLGAFAFPLLVKLRLANGGHLALTDEDRIDIDVFEQLACVDHFQPREIASTAPHPWTTVRDGVQGQRALRMALERTWTEYEARAEGEPNSL